MNSYATPLQVKTTCLNEPRSWFRPFGVWLATIVMLLDSYLFIRKQEYFNNFKQLGAVG